MANVKRKLRSKVSYLEHVTYWGRCSEKTKAGDDCRNHVLFANGRCASHGGTTPKNRRDWTKEARDKFEERRGKLIRHAERFDKKLERKKRKWQAASLGASHKVSPDSARARTNTASLAAASSSVSPNPAVRPAAGSMAAQGSSERPRPEKRSYGAGQTSQAQRPKQDASELTRISCSPGAGIQTGQNPRTGNGPTSLTLGSSPGGLASASSNSARQESPKAAPREGEDSRACVPASDPVPRPAPPSLIPWTTWLRNLVNDSRRSIADDYIEPGSRLEPKTYRD